MNKKVLGFALAFIFLAMLVAPVMAGKGQNRLTIRFELGTYDGTTLTFDKIFNSPKKMIYPDEMSRVTHFRGMDWGDPATHEGFSIIVDDGGLNEETFDDEDITYTCLYNAEAHNLNYGEMVPYVQMVIKVKETWDLGERGYIEMKVVDHINDYANFNGEYFAAGSFVGQGVIDGQQIKVSGDSGDLGSGVFREGIVMGWP